MKQHLYPRDLAHYIFNNCERFAKDLVFPEDESLIAAELGLPDIDAMESLLSTCYQASLMTHEGLNVSFRLILADPEAFDGLDGSPDGVQKLEFAEYMPLSASSLRRISPAASFARSIIAARYDPEIGPEIWGIIHTGPRWLHTSHGGRGSAPKLPDALVVKVMGPGVLEVSLGGKTLVSLSEGKVHGQSLNVFRAGWLQDFFAPIRQERHEIHKEAMQGAEEDWQELDSELTKIIDQQMMKRVIAAMRAFRHGGTLLFVPPDRASELMQVNPYLTMKYKFAESEGRGRFRTLIVDIMNTLASLPSDDSHRVGWLEYQQTSDPRITALDEAIFETSHLISSLSVADGAVVLTKRFEILGFSAEIHCETSEVSQIAKALDLEANKCRFESVIGVGTRHSSAYRICRELKDALAIVVSQEGNVQFVRWMNDKLVFWEHQGSFDFSNLN
ncbi:MAG: DNA integrity scanning protein DisA nucleotide-binding domain protein [Candidatus Melainabacteria bacterium]|nr:DNA integrity scanning protein DisA nucleotide-binding domain protein [Candidatus Melainabacteria bacterium]